jgi:hypothetical protein
MQLKREQVDAFIKDAHATADRLLSGSRWQKCKDWLLQDAVRPNNLTVLVILSVVILLD